MKQLIEELQGLYETYSKGLDNIEVTAAAMHIANRLPTILARLKAADELAEAVAEFVQHAHDPSHCAKNNLIPKLRAALSKYKEAVEE